MNHHFDGKKYRNPTLNKQFNPGLGKILRMLTVRRKEWPKRPIPASPSPQTIQSIADHLTITFVNHATFLIQFPGYNILTDPVWSDRASPYSWLGPKRYREPGIPLENLPPIDLILLSHNHYDHLDVQTLRKLNHKFSPKVLVSMGNKSLIQSLGIVEVEEMDWWEDQKVDDRIKITFTPAQHFSARGLWDRYRTLWGSFYIQHTNQDVYFGADSGYATHFKDIKNRLGAPDIAILGIGAYDPGWFMSPIHMNPAEAVQAHLDLEAHTSIAMHYGTFRLAAESYDDPIIKLRKAKKRFGVAEDRFITLREGYPWSPSTH